MGKAPATKGQKATRESRVEFEEGTAYDGRAIVSTTPLAKPDLDTPVSAPEKGRPQQDLVTVVAAVAAASSVELSEVKDPTALCGEEKVNPRADDDMRDLNLTHPWPPPAVSVDVVVPPVTYAPLYAGCTAGLATLAITTIKLTTLVAVAHVAGPMVLSGVAYEGARRAWSYLTGDDAHLHDVQSEVKAMSEKYAVDPELLAHVAMAATGEARSAELARGLKRAGVSWCKTHRKGWSEVVVLHQVTRVVTVSMAYTRVEASRQTWWGARQHLRDMWMATGVNAGNLGNGNSLPPA